MGKEPSRSLELGSAVVGRTRGLTGSRCDQWRGAGGSWGRDAQGTRVNGPLCTRGMNGGLCKGQRGGAAGSRNAWVPGELAGKRDRREFTFVELPTAYQALSQALTHLEGVAILSVIMIIY